MLIMRKLSILFSFFLLTTVAVFAQCATITINSMEVIPDPSNPGFYLLEVEMDNTGLAITSTVTITPTFNISTGAQLTVDPLTIPGTTGIPFGISNHLFPVSSDLLDYVDAIASGGSFFLAGTFDFTGALTCTEQYYILVAVDSWGCSDPAAFNYDAAVTLDVVDCITTICAFLDFISMDIVLDGFGNPVFQVIMSNSLEDYDLHQGSIFIDITNTNGETFDVDEASPQNVNLDHAVNGVPGFDIVQFDMESELDELTGDSLYLEGTFNYTVVVNGQIENCILTLDQTIDISRIGCTDNTAYNYDPYNIIDDGDCVYPITVVPFVVEPPCSEVPGSIDIEGLFTSGGTPPYSYDYYTIDPSAVGPGQYLFTVYDSTPASENGPIIHNVLVTVPTPPEFYVNIVLNYPLFVATVNNPVGMYYWLLDGVLIDSTYTNTYAYVDSGSYTCFVRGIGGNGCWDYSNEVYADSLSLDDDFMNSNISLYPNPTAVELNLDNVPSTIENLDFFIVNALGAKVMRGTMYDDFRIQTGELANGMYYLQLLNNRTLKTIPFTVQH